MNLLLLIQVIEACIWNKKIIVDCRMIIYGTNVLGFFLQYIFLKLTYTSTRSYYNLNIGLKWFKSLKFFFIIIIIICNFLSR